MTKQELAALGLALFGHQWQAPLARAIGISPRHMRRLAAGDAPITDGIEADIHKVLGASAVADPDWPRDRWIVGDAPVERDTGARREYIVHTRRPRFIARVVACTDDGLPQQQEQPADIVTGVVYSSDDFLLSEIVWLDPVPAADKLHALMEEACDMIDGD